MEKNYKGRNDYFRKYREEHREKIREYSRNNMRRRRAKDRDIKVK